MRYKLGVSSPVLLLHPSKPYRRVSTLQGASGGCFSRAGGQRMQGQRHYILTRAAPSSGYECMQHGNTPHLQGHGGAQVAMTTEESSGGFDASSTVE